MTPDHLVTSPGLCLCPGSDPGPPLVTRTRRRVRRQRTKEAGARPAGRPVNGHPPVVPPPPAPGARFSSKLNLDRTNLAVPLCRDDASYVATQYFWPISYIMTFRSVAYCIRCIIARCCARRSPRADAAMDIRRSSHPLPRAVRVSATAWVSRPPCRRPPLTVRTRGSASGICWVRTPPPATTAAGKPPPDTDTNLGSDELVWAATDLVRHREPPDRVTVSPLPHHEPYRTSVHTVY